MHFISFYLPYWTNEESSIMLSRSGKGRYLCLILNLKSELFHFSLLIMVVVVDFFFGMCLLSSWGSFFLLVVHWVFIVSRYWNFSDTFSTSVAIIMLIFFLPPNMVKYTDFWMLHSWDESHLVMMHCLFIYGWV